MKNPIYLTEEGRKEIVEIIEFIKKDIIIDEFDDFIISAKVRVWEEILSNSIILPKEEKWQDFITNFEDFDYLYKVKPNGVIIKQ